MIKRVCPSLLVCLLALLSIPCQAQSKSRFDVRLVISADEQIKGQIESYVSRELRSLGDVVLVDRDELYTIAIIAFEVSNNNNAHQLGYAFSVLITSSFPTDMLTTVLSSHKVNREVVKNWDELVSDYKLVEDYHLITCDLNNLRKTCERIIADFDTKQLQPSRKAASRKRN